MHLIAAAGAPSVVLFSAHSDPALCAPRGRVTVLREAALADLAVGAVMAAAWRDFADPAAGNLDPAINHDHMS
jgi:hypothetical protein